MIAGGAVGSYSDRRIKKNIVDVDGSTSLGLLRAIRPRQYRYRDVVTHTDNLVYGYIAQEVKEVLPYAVQEITETIPNIYEVAVADGHTLTFASFDTSLLNPASTRLELVDITGKNHMVNITSVTSTHTIVVAETLDMAHEGSVFVLGQEVSDFNVLSKERINVVAVSALRALDGVVTAQATTIAALEARVAALEG